MRVLHFLPVYAPAWQFGGPVLSVSRLCEGLVERGIEVRVITTNAGLSDFPHYQLSSPQIVNGVHVIYYPVDQDRGPIRSSALVNALPEHMKWADLLHLSSIWQPLGIPVQQAAHAAGVPVIQTLRGALGPYSWRRGFLKKVLYFWLKERPFLQRAQALHCTTTQEAREIACLGLKPPIKLLPNPLKLSQLYCDHDLRIQWRRRLGLPIDQPVFLVIGRLHHKKGLDLLPKVLTELTQYPWQILFVGQEQDGTGRKLRQAFKREGLTNRCHWIDFLPAEDLIGPYNASDCLLLPSLHENFGNVVVEALACGCGVLISDRVGVSELLTNCPGVRTRRRITTLWVNELREILFSKRPGIMSEKWVKSRFSSNLIAAQSFKIYSQLLHHD